MDFQASSNSNMMLDWGRTPTNALSAWNSIDVHPESGSFESDSLCCVAASSSMWIQSWWSEMHNERKTASRLQSPSSSSSILLRFVGLELSRLLCSIFFMWIVSCSCWSFRESITNMKTFHFDGSATPIFSWSSRDQSRVGSLAHKS